MAGFYEVANWREYQHYKDRNPPWIKLHFALLSSETWVSLDDAGRVLAVACMLLASRNEGRVPADPAYIKRVAYLSDLPNFKPLVNSGFLIDASGLQADASTKQADARPEERRDREEKRQTTRPRADAALFRWDEFASIYPTTGMTYDSAARNWWAKNVHAGDDALVDSILAGVRRWNASERHKNGFVANCGKFLREGAYLKQTPDDSKKAKQSSDLDDIFRGCEN